MADEQNEPKAVDVSFLNWLEEKFKTLFISEAEAKEALKEVALIETQAIPLTEKALRRDNSVGLKIIQPGWGSSGFYSPEMLERDGPKVFKSGTQMYWDHQTLEEELSRPEGSLRNLAAQLTSNARWDANGPSGPGLYADAQVFSPYQESINELAGHIGVSIRAEGQAKHGMAEGKEGPIIEKITNARSVDFVTQAGAGGEILQLFESARQRAHERSNAMSEEPKDTQLLERVSLLEQENARLRERDLLREARDAVNQALRQVTLPDVTKQRLAERLSTNPPVSDNALDTESLMNRVKDAIEAERKYLADYLREAGYGRVTGMGSTSPLESEGQEFKLEESLEASFKTLGLDPGTAKEAAKGR